jgi:glycosyltransferase involved in cell wall biosynthesis
MAINRLVSVIIPAYNCANYIEDTLACVFAQHYPLVEILVVDDGSRDDTVKILQPLAEQGKIRLIQQANQGAAAARNTGLKQANGEFIAFLDSDDYWVKNKLALQVAYLDAHPQTGAVYAAWHEWHGDNNGNFPPPASVIAEVSNNSLEIDPAFSGWVYVPLLHDCVIHTSAIMIRSELLASLGLFDETLRIGEDYDLWLRLSRLTKIDKLITPLSLYKIHAESLVNKQPLAICYRAKVIQRAITQWGYQGQDGSKASKAQMQQLLANIHFDFAYQHYKAGNRQFALAHLLKQVRFYPYLAVKAVALIAAIIKNQRD